MTRSPGDSEVLLVTCDEELAESMAGTVGGADLRLVAARGEEEARTRVRSAAVELAIVDHVPGNGCLRLVTDLVRINPAVGLLVIVGPDDVEGAIEAARQGAYDFFTRPVEVSKVPIRLRVALERHRRELNDRAYRLALEERVLSKTEEIQENRTRLRSQLMATIESLARALQWKDAYTEGHSRRVAAKSADIARAMGLPREAVRQIELAALFHDIGKIGIRDDVLNKPGDLTGEEYEHMKQHPLVAEQILSPIEELRPILPIVKHEHEQWDGKGYPDGLRGEGIPLASRIIAVADAFDSMVFDRVYRRAIGVEEALAELERGAGVRFDPGVVGAFCALERAAAVTSGTARA
ncbi:MAG: HD domain-containing protein [Planctomycetes bacterium]|nr:HD domain-containing protein [Planctomycetota bacterium]